MDDDGNVIYKIEKEDNFRHIVPKLKVLARSTPQDKFALVVGMQKMGHVVAVTGESHNDALALQTTDVGFCMGGGCESAKDAAAMSLMNDDFSSTLNAVMWGRNIY